MDEAILKLCDMHYRKEQERIDVLEKQGYHCRRRGIKTWNEKKQGRNLWRRMRSGILVEIMISKMYVYVYMAVYVYMYTCACKCVYV